MEMSVSSEMTFFTTKQQSEICPHLRTGSSAEDRGRIDTRGWTGISGKNILSINNIMVSFSLADLSLFIFTVLLNLTLFLFRILIIFDYAMDSMGFTVVCSCWCYTWIHANDGCLMLLFLLLWELILTLLLLLWWWWMLLLFPVNCYAMFQQQGIFSQQHLQCLFLPQ